MKLPQFALNIFRYSTQPKHVFPPSTGVTVSSWVSGSFYFPLYYLPQTTIPFQPLIICPKLLAPQAEALRECAHPIEQLIVPSGLRQPSTSTLLPLINIKYLIFLLSRMLITGISLTGYEILIQDCRVVWQVRLF